MTLSCFAISEQLVHHRKLLSNSIAEFRVQAHFDFGRDFGETQEENSSDNDEEPYRVGMAEIGDIFRRISKTISVKCTTCPLIRRRPGSETI